MTRADTIAALTTPPTPAARAIVRTSGDRAFALAASLGSLKTEAFERTPIAIGVRLALAEGIVVPATLLAFEGPRSSTGEDVVEYHLPGSPLLVRLLLARLFAGGARQAAPGEFTSRAFLNAKLDLSAAEGVVATIGASSRAELDAARRLLAGELADRLRPIIGRVADTLALVEVNLDFSGEDVSFIDADTVRDRSLALAGDLDALLNGSRRYERANHEPRVVFVGRPNAGKSSLLNALAGIDRAVVSEVAGTTRDALSARVDVGGRHLTIVDVAGLDDTPGDAPGDTPGDDPIATQMAAAARREVVRADLIALVRAVDDARPSLDAGRRADLLIATKSDLGAPCWTADVTVSAVTGAGLPRLRAALLTRAFGDEPLESGDAVALNARHRDLIARATAALAAAARAVDDGPEFAAAELRAALDALGGVVGAVSADDVLGRIFGGFCIGK